MTVTVWPVTVTVGLTAARQRPGAGGPARAAAAANWQSRSHAGQTVLERMSHVPILFLKISFISVTAHYSSDVRFVLN